MMLLRLLAGTRLKSLSTLVLLCTAGTVSAQGVYTQSNTTKINVKKANGSAFSTTDLYPSAITFAGIPTREHISKITITLTGLTLSDTNAVMAAVAKQGSGPSALLFDGPGSVGNSASGLTLTFDETATNSLPTAGSFGSGTYKPDFVNTGYNDILPIGTAANPANPAPQTAAPNYPTDFSAFDGQNPNGTYLLFVNDFYPDSSGSLNMGWSVSIKTTVPAPSSLLVVGMGALFGFGFAAHSRRRRSA